MAEQTYKLIEHPDDLVAGRTYSASTHTNRGVIRVGGVFRGMRSAWCKVCTKHHLVIMLRGCAIKDKLCWEGSYDWREHTQGKHSA